MTEEKNNPKPSEKAEPASEPISEAQRKENALSSITMMEKQHPGITEQFLRYDNEELPPCLHCGSQDTAKVHAGVVGRTIYLAGASRKFKLVPNRSDEIGTYFCNECKKYFN